MKYIKKKHVYIHIDKYAKNYFIFLKKNVFYYDFLLNLKNKI